MIWTGLLGEADVPDTLLFYKSNAHYGLRAPTEEECQNGRLGKQLFLVGVRMNGRLIAVAWIAWKSNFIHTVFSGDTLFLVDEGPFADSGGWCIHKDLQGRELFQLLTATVFVSWFKEINTEEALPLWGRMMGQKDANGAPLFWSKVGEALTGLSYHTLLELPFGSMEREILSSWPKEPLFLSSVPREVLLSKGKTFAPLISAGRRLSQWGFVDTALYVPTSLNFFKRVTKGTLHESIGDLDAFFQEARGRALVSLNSLTT